MYRADQAFGIKSNNQKEDQGNDTCIEARYGMFSGSDFLHRYTLIRHSR
jgi:hypothetical protein